MERPLWTHLEVCLSHLEVCLSIHLPGDSKSSHTDNQNQPSHCPFDVTDILQHLVINSSVSSLLLPSLTTPTWSASTTLLSSLERKGPCWSIPLPSRCLQKKLGQPWGRGPRGCVCQHLIQCLARVLPEILQEQRQQGGAPYLWPSSGSPGTEKNLPEASCQPAASCLL